jgi:hypothetical protein
VKLLALVAFLLPLVVTVSSALVPAASAATWERPVAGPVLRPFALSADPFARGQHRGVDLAAPLGSPVGAACGGRVRFAGRVPGGGRTVSVGCDRVVATYQHLGAIEVHRGQRLLPGTSIGTVGRSGHPRDPRAHVHLGARETGHGRYLDPMTLLGPGPRAGPPAVPVPRRPAPLGPAPRPAARRPAPAVPRPATRRPAPAVPRPATRRPAPAVPRPAARRSLPVEPPAQQAPVVDRRGAPAPRPALLVWAGLVVFGLGLPLGGLAGLWRHRRGRFSHDLRARGWAPAHR